MKRRLLKPSALPGFGLTLGYSLAYLGVMVLLPLAALGLRALTLSPARFWAIVSGPREVASYRLTFGAAAAAALINAVFGFIVAWTLTRYRFWGRKLLDAAVDLPFALPTAVSGIALAALWSAKGWLGRSGLALAFTPAGVVVALVFIGLPFVVRTLQPALTELEPELEEAAASLGASGWQTFRRVIFPALWPPLLTGFALAFARGLGEYGSVIFIAGNMPMRTEITSLLIVTKLEQFDYAGATALAVVTLAASFAILLAINVVQWRAGQRGRAGG
jgi:sulfate transport system permease protein